MIKADGRRQNRPKYQQYFVQFSQTEKSLKKVLTNPKQSATMYTAVRKSAQIKAKANKNKEKTKMTKFEKKWVDAYDRATARELYEVYGRYSDAKRKAYDYCMRLVHYYDAIEYKIVSHNSNVFTFGFIYENKETGELKLRIETALNSYTMNYLPKGGEN